MEGPVEAGMKAALKVLNEMGPGEPGPLSPFPHSFERNIRSAKVEEKTGTAWWGRDGGRGGKELGTRTRTKKTF